MLYVYTIHVRQKNVFTSYFNENKCDGESLVSLSDNVYYFYIISTKQIDFLRFCTAYVCNFRNALRLIFLCVFFSIFPVICDNERLTIVSRISVSYFFINLLTKMILQINGGYGPETTDYFTTSYIESLRFFPNLHFTILITITTKAHNKWWVEIQTIFSLLARWQILWKIPNFICFKLLFKTASNKNRNLDFDLNLTEQENCIKNVFLQNDTSTVSRSQIHV